MPRLVPVIDLGTPARWEVSLRYIDATGDLRSDSFIFTTAPTDTNIDALVGALGIQSNASLYEVKLARVFASVGDSSDAIAAPKESASQNLVFLAKNPAGDTRNLFLPAPIASSFIATTDEIDPTSVGVINILAAWVNLLPVGYAIVSGRFTGRREKNRAIKI